MPEFHNTLPYTVRDGSPIILRVTAEYGQIAVISLMLGDRIWSPSQEAMETDGATIAEDGATLRSRSLHCRTNVVDVHRGHNKTWVRFELSGGAEGPKEFSYGQEASGDFGTATYVLEFAFV